ncbi:hypothetical protein NQ317_001868 [Molorchus minor]|uniref:Uncharacterized protein n=1 Tax=Molorchus minor TaxID=1323400 RepID=A0ABQ9K0K3_9CUCU|nr:hypothetical protein NQ317_001868 [Molorchus minor]
MPKVENECGEIPTVIVQNKIDLLEQSVVNPLTDCFAFGDLYATNIILDVFGWPPGLRKPLSRDISNSSYLLANSSGALSSQSVENPEEAELLARALGCRLLRTSVKEDVNVAAVFRHLAAKCLADLRDPRDYDYFTTPTSHHPNSLTISAFSPSHSSKNHNGTIVLRPTKHKKRKNVLKNALVICTMIALRGTDNNLVLICGADKGDMSIFQSYLLDSLLIETST